MNGRPTLTPAENFPLMAECSCGHLVMHGWHLKSGCQFADCHCHLDAGAALLASGWLAARVVEAVDRERAAWVAKIEEVVVDLRAETDAWTARSRAAGESEPATRTLARLGGVAGRIVASLLSADDTEGKP